MLRRGGVPAFRTPESCGDAMAAVFARSAPRAGFSSAAPARGSGATLDEDASYAVLERVGVPAAPRAVVAVDDLPPALPLPGPVAVKVLSAAGPAQERRGRGAARRR